MDAINALGPKLSALLALAAVAYALLSFAPILWPAIATWRTRPLLPHRWLFIGVVAALVYGAFSFLAFAILLPVEAYGIFVAPQLEESGVAAGRPLLRASGFAAKYWWLLIPPVQLLLTWYITRQLKARWAHICTPPPDNSIKPNPLRGSAHPRTLPSQNISDVE